MPCPILEQAAITVAEHWLSVGPVEVYHVRKKENLRIEVHQLENKKYV